MRRGSPSCCQGRTEAAPLEWFAYRGSLVLFNRVVGTGVQFTTRGLRINGRGRGRAPHPSAPSRCARHASWGWAPWCRSCCSAPPPRSPRCKRSCTPPRTPRTEGVSDTRLEAALVSAKCRLELTWSTPRAGTACPPCALQLPLARRRDRARPWAPTLQSQHPSWLHRETLRSGVIRRGGVPRHMGRGDA